MNQWKLKQADYIHFISVHGVTFYFNSLTAKPVKNNKKKNQFDFNSCKNKQDTQNFQDLALALDTTLIFRT